MYTFVFIQMSMCVCVRGWVCVRVRACVVKRSEQIIWFGRSSARAVCVCMCLCVCLYVKGCTLLFLLDVIVVWISMDPDIFLCNISVYESATLLMWMYVNMICKKLKLLSCESFNVRLVCVQYVYICINIIVCVRACVCLCLCVRSCVCVCLCVRR